MDETKRHIIDDIRASELPDRIRGDFPPDVHVTVTVEEVRQLHRKRLSDFVGRGSGLYDTPEDVLKELRALRDSD
jgi:hypothetical protein